MWKQGICHEFFLCSCDKIDMAYRFQAWHLSETASTFVIIWWSSQEDKAQSEAPLCFRITLKSLYALDEPYW